MPRKNKKSLKWAIGSIIIAVLIFFIGISFATELTPKDLPHASKTLYYNVSINFNCFPEGEERSYVTKSDKLECVFWYNATDFNKTSMTIGARLILVGEGSMESNDFINRTVKNGELIKFTLGKTYGFRQNELYRVIFDVAFFGPITSGDKLEDDFNVHSSDEIAQRNLNRNLIIVMLLTGIFGIFTGIHDLKKLAKSE
ncbi:MAG: hypothetical protein KKB25_00835 [Nanoarchaeota archaeon]|nr:hypothetical protein [Nanoarchaeota archaeon]